MCGGADSSQREVFGSLEVIVSDELRHSCPCFRSLPTASLRHAADKHAVQKVETLVVEAHPLQITEDFFSLRTVGVRETASRQVHAILKKLELLDAEGFLTQDPR